MSVTGMGSPGTAQTTPRMAAPVICAFATCDLLLREHHDGGRETGVVGDAGFVASEPAGNRGPQRLAGEAHDGCSTRCGDDLDLGHRHTATQAESERLEHRLLCREPAGEERSEE